MRVENGYRFVRTLGAGSFGTTFLAIQISTGKKVAIKVFGDEDNKMTRSKLAGIMEDWVWEKKMLAALLEECYPFAVCIIDSYIKNTIPRLVMDFVSGQSLTKKLFETKFPRPDDNLLKDLVNGIKIIHSHGIVHEDIKGDNIIYDNDLKIWRYIDFGLACLKKSSMFDFGKKLFPCGTYGTRYITSPDLEDAREEHAVVPWNVLEAHDYWSIGLEVLRWHTFKAKILYYLTEYKSYCKENGLPMPTKEFIDETHLKSFHPLYFLLPSEFIEREICKVTDIKIRVMLFLLLEFDGPKRVENFPTVCAILDGKFDELFI